LDSEITFHPDWDLPALTPTANPQVMKRREQTLTICELIRANPTGIRQAEIIEEMLSQGISRSTTMRLLSAREGDLWFSQGSGIGRGSSKLYFLRIKLK
jgi:hypothetical protein